MPGEAHQKAEAPSRATTGRFGAAGAAGRIVPEADGRVVCSLPVLAFPDHDRDGKPVWAGDAVGWGCQIQPRERASWTASWRLAAPSLAAAEER